MFARHRHAARMDHVGLDLPRPQPTREPKPIASSLKGNDDPADRLARLDGFVSRRTLASTLRRTGEARSLSAVTTTLVSRQIIRRKSAVAAAWEVAADHPA